MSFMYTFRDIVSGRRMHRNFVVGPTCNELVSRLDKVGYSRALILHAIEATYDFLTLSIYAPAIAKTSNPRKISKESCGRIFDVLITTLLMEMPSDEDYNLDLAISEFTSISNNISELREFCKSYQEALKNEESPNSHVIEYISKQHLIPSLGEHPKTENAVLLAWILRSKLYHRQMQPHLSKMHAAISFALSDMFPPAQQTIIEAHRISPPTDSKIECDVLIPLTTLKSWSREHCTVSASDPEQSCSVPFKLYYWSNYPGTLDRSVEPLPGEFLGLIYKDLVNLLETKRAAAYCHACEKYCSEPDLNLEEVGQDAATKTVETKRLCYCGKMLWSVRSEIRLTLTP